MVKWGILTRAPNLVTIVSLHTTLCPPILTMVVLTMGILMPSPLFCGRRSPNMTLLLACNIIFFLWGALYSANSGAFQFGGRQGYPQGVRPQPLIQEFCEAMFSSHLQEEGEAKLSQACVLG